MLHNAKASVGYVYECVWVPVSVLYVGVCVCTCTLCRCVCTCTCRCVSHFPPQKLLESLRRRAVWRLGTDVFSIPPRERGQQRERKQQRMRKEKQKSARKGEKEREKEVTAQPSLSIGPEPRLARPPEVVWVFWFDTGGFRLVLACPLTDLSDRSQRWDRQRGGQTVWTLWLAGLR